MNYNNKDDLSMHKKTLSSGLGELGCREHLDDRDTNKSGYE
jgi:hypothetical protein